MSEDSNDRAVRLRKDQELIQSIQTFEDYA